MLFRKMFGKEWTEVRQKSASFSGGPDGLRQLGFDILLGKFSGTCVFFFRFRGRKLFSKNHPVIVTSE